MKNQLTNQLSEFENAAHFQIAHFGRMQKIFMKVINIICLLLLSLMVYADEYECHFKHSYHTLSPSTSMSTTRRDGHSLVNKVKTNIITADLPDFEDLLLELSFFIHNDGWVPRPGAERERAFKPYHIMHEQRQRFEKGQVAAIARYTGDGSEDSRLYNGMILGYVLSRSTGALHDGFFEECLRQLQSGKSSEEMHASLDPEHVKDPLWSTEKFKFEYYDQFVENGDGVGFLLLAITNESFRGHGLAQVLLKSTLDYYQSQGYHFVYVIGRLAGLKKAHGHPAGMLHIHEYLRRTRTDGLHPDHTVRFHQKAGVHIVCALPCCAIDPDSAGSGFLGIYDLQTRTSA